MAKFGSYTIVSSGKTRQQTLILLNPKRLEAEKEAAEQLGLDTGEVFVCMGHHEPSAATKQWVVLMPFNKQFGERTALQLNHSAQLIETRKPDSNI